MPDADRDCSAKILRKANRKYFRPGERRQQEPEPARDLDSLAGFETYLENMAVLQ